MTSSLILSVLEPKVFQYNFLEGNSVDLRKWLLSYFNTHKCSRHLAMLLVSGPESVTILSPEFWQHKGTTERVAYKQIQLSL